MSVEASSSGTAAAVVVVSCHSIGTGLRVIARASLKQEFVQPFEILLHHDVVGDNPRGINSRWF